MASGQKTPTGVSAFGRFIRGVLFWPGLARVVNDVMSLVGNGVMGSMFSSAERGAACAVWVGSRGI